MEDFRIYKLRAAQLMHLSDNKETLEGYKANEYNTSSMTFGILKGDNFINKDNTSYKIYEHYYRIVDKKVIIIWKNESPGIKEVFADLMSENFFSYDLHTNMSEDAVFSLLSFIENEFYKKQYVPSNESINNKFQLLKKH